MDNDEKRILDIIRDGSFHFWQSLLAVNALYTALITGVYSFIGINNENLKYGLFVVLVLLCFSSFLIVANFKETRDMFSLIAKLTPEDLKNKDMHTRKAAETYRIIKRNEDIALVISGVITIIFALSLLFLMPKQQ